MRNCHGAPRKLLEARIRAFEKGDFGFVYDSYHPDAPFLAQFPERAEYLAYAEEVIAGSCSIEKVTVLYEEQQGETALVIFQQLLRIEGGYQESFELARLERGGGEWKYLGSERISRGDFRGRPDQLRPADFERVPNRVFF